MIDTVAALPTARPADRPLEPPAELGALRELHPLVPMVYPDGHEGWLATGHQVVRALLSDPHFSSRYELMHYPLPGLPLETLPPAPVGDLTGIDPPGHTRYRRLLVGYFTARRMQTLTARAEELAREHLDAMQRQGPPADLVAAFATPIPALVICELLGVPYADRATFQRQVLTLMSQSSSLEEKAAAMGGLQEYMLALVRAKRGEPSDDIISALTASDLDDDELAGIGGLLLAAGFDTTASMLALGTFALLLHPDQLAALRADPGLAEQAVEELLRYLTIAHTNLRAAVEDVELAGRVIRAGQTVTLAMQAANRDPQQFPDPDSLDLRRRTTGHVAFGYGTHLCLGAQLARVEMRVALPALLTRFPTLRLDCLPSEVPMRTDANLYGAHRLPVSW